jgi:hypothetical protein
MGDTTESEHLKTSRLEGWRCLRHEIMVLLHLRVGISHYVISSWASRDLEGHRITNCLFPKVSIVGNKLSWNCKAKNTTWAITCFFKMYVCQKDAWEALWKALHHKRKWKWREKNWLLPLVWITMLLHLWVGLVNLEKGVTWITMASKSIASFLEVSTLNKCWVTNVHLSCPLHFLMIGWYYMVHMDTYAVIRFTIVIRCILFFSLTLICVNVLEWVSCFRLSGSC